MTAATVPASESRKSDRTRQTILDAAAYLFREHGFSATTLRQIASQAQIKAGSIYYYFGSKDEILDEVMEHGIRVVYEAVENAVSALSEDAAGRLRLETAVATHLYTLLRYGDYTSANIQNFRHVSPTIRDRNRAIRQNYSEYWTGLFKQAQDSGEIRQDIDLSIARLYLLGTLNWTIEWYDPNGDATDVLAKKFCALFFEGAAT